MSPQPDRPEAHEHAPRFARVFMIGHAHLDPVWLWRWTEGYQEARAMVHAAVGLIAENEDYVFTLEQMAVLDWIREGDPELFETVRRLVAEGRIAIAGGWWVEPDCNLPSLESFVRHGLIGQRFLLKHFGGIATIGFNADPFGHSFALPQILAGQHIDAYCFLRPGPHESEFKETLFTWIGLDGSAVTAYRIPHQYCTADGALDGHMDEALARIGPSVEGQAMVFYGVGNHGGGPTRRNLESLARIGGSGRHGALVLSGPGRYFEAVRAQDRPLPEWRSELQRHAAGCYAAHSGIKRLNLRAESALLEAERYATLAARTGGISYPGARLEEAWKTLLFNQFHDILPGSAIPAAYEDAANQLGGVLAAAEQITNLCLQTTARKLSVPLDEATQPLLVFNPHPFPVSMPVEMELSFAASPWSLATEEGEHVPMQKIQPHATLEEFDRFRNRFRRRIVFTADVPAFGHRLYRLHASQPPEGTARDAVTVEGTTLRNAHLSVTIDPETGWLKQLVTRTDGFDFADPRGRPHTVVSDDRSDTWGHRVETYVGPGAPLAVESVTVEDTGPVRGTIRVVSRYGASRLTERFVLHAGARFLEIEVELDWREERKLLKLRFPSAIRADRADYQLQYGHMSRPADGKEYPGQRWVSVCDENDPRRPRLTVVNDAKYAYDCIDGDIGITAARSPAYAWHDPCPLEPGRRYRYQDQGIQRFTCRVVPQSGDDDFGSLTRQAEILTMPLRVMMESFHAGEIPAVRGLLSGLEERPEVSLTALKPWEDDPDATVIRLANQSGTTQEVRLSLDFLGRRHLSARLPPYGVRTFVVPPRAEAAPFEVDLLEFSPDRSLPVLSKGV